MIPIKKEKRKTKKTHRGPSTEDREQPSQESNKRQLISLTSLFYQTWLKKKSFTANKSMNVKRKKNTVDSVRAGSLFHQIIYKCQPHGVWEGGNESTWAWKILNKFEYSVHLLFPVRVNTSFFVHHIEWLSSTPFLTAWATVIFNIAAWFLLCCLAWCWDQ